MDIYGKAHQIRLSKGESAYSNLSIKDRVLLCVVELEVEVNNGGFHQYYLNSAGDLAFFAPTALNMIGADKASEITQRANEFFGDLVPKDRAERIDILMGLGEIGYEQWEDLDAKFYSYPDDVAHLLDVFLRTP